MTDASRRAADADIFTPRGVVLEVDDLHVSFRGRRRLAPRVRAVNGGSFPSGPPAPLGRTGKG